MPGRISFVHVLINVLLSQLLIFKSVIYKHYIYNLHSIYSIDIPFILRSSMGKVSLGLLLYTNYPVRDLMGIKIAPTVSDGGSKEKF